MKINLDNPFINHPASDIEMQDFIFQEKLNKSLSKILKRNIIGNEDFKDKIIIFLQDSIIAISKRRYKRLHN